jgi:hypothetical protein
MRYVALLVALFALTGCTVVFIPIPLTMPARPVTAVTQTPQAAQLGTATEYAEFTTKYNALDAPWAALQAHLQEPNFEDQTWRNETAQLAGDWRVAIDALRNMPQPSGERWAQAWPLLMQGLDEYAYAAGAIENAAKSNEPMLMEPARGKIIDGVNLIGEAMRSLSDKP